MPVRPPDSPTGEVIAVDIPELLNMLNAGRKSATDIGMAAGKKKDLLPDEK